MSMTRGDLLALVRRLLSPSGVTNEERMDLANRLRAEARDPELIERIFRLDSPLTPDEIVDLVAMSRSAGLRVPSLN
jgi:asparagine synthetase B (glutamine-hydrolysing)